jgi:dTDP-4-dehydrorhamnose reductase
MVAGRGLLGKALKEIDREDIIFYANGVSDSTIESIADGYFEENEITAFAKETSAKTFVYFSTIQVNAAENLQRPYVIHKIKMEELVKRLFPDYLIIRTSNIIGRNLWNRHTLFNFLYSSLKEEKRIPIVDSALRNILDVDHFMRLVDHYIIHYKKEPATLNIVNSLSYSMFEIIREFETIFQRKFIRSEAEIKIAKFEAPCLFSAKLIEESGIELNNYLADVIKKYYPPFITGQPL